MEHPAGAVADRTSFRGGTEAVEERRGAMVYTRTSGVVQRPSEEGIEALDDISGAVQRQWKKEGVLWNIHQKRYRGQEEGRGLWNIYKGRYRGQEEDRLALEHL